MDTNARSQDEKHFNSHNKDHFNFPASFSHASTADGGTSLFSPECNKHVSLGRTGTSLLSSPVSPKNRTAYIFRPPLSTRARVTALIVLKNKCASKVLSWLANVAHVPFFPSTANLGDFGNGTTVSKIASPMTMNRVSTPPRTSPQSVKNVASAPFSSLSPESKDCRYSWAHSVGGKSVSEEDAAEVFLPLAKLTQPRPHSGGACRATRFDANARRVGAPAKAHEGAKTAARDISLDDPRRGVLWRCLWALLEKICANKITARNLSFIRHHLQSGHSSASSRAHPPPPVARTAHAARTGSNMAALPIASPLAHAVRGTPLSSRRTPNGLRKAWCAPKSVRARARALSLRASVSEPAAADTAAVVTPGGDQFDWHKAWYPMSPIDFLDPLVPNKLNLLGRAMVAWRAGDGSWSVVDDSCPHRMAPLSLGYLDDKQRLTCRYHGWAFDKQGTAVEIPMSVDGNANATACASSRSCATSFPVKVRVTRFPNPDTLLYLSAGDCCPYIAQHGTDTFFYSFTRTKPVFCGCGPRLVLTRGLKLLRRQ